MSYAVLCADIGTSSLKAALISNSGDVIIATSERFNKKFNSNRWLEAFAKASNYLIKKLQFNRLEVPEIKAIAISGNGPSLANSGGSFLWNEPLKENEVASEIVKLNSDFSLYLPRLLHIKHTMPEIWNCGEPVFSVPEYLVYQLTGTAQTILPEPRFASAYWTPLTLREFGIPPEKLPPLTALGTTAGSLLPEMTAKLGLPAGSLPEVFCGGPDFTIALIGTNTLSAGKICDRAGTSEGINLCTQKPVYSKSIRTLPSPATDLWNASIIIPDSGLRFSSWKHENLYADIPYEDCVNYLQNHQDIDGYSLIVKIAFEVRAAYKQLFNAAAALNIKIPSVIYSTGGQAKNKLWMQMKADIIGIPFVVTTCPDSELTGDAIIALCGLGEYQTIQEAADSIVKDDITYYPDKERQLFYADFYRTNILAKQ